MVGKYFFCVIISAAACANPIEVVDFDVSMGKGSELYEQCLRSFDRYDRIISPATLLLNFFKNLYERNNPSQVTYHQKEKIPKIVHHIWLGKKFPKKYEKLRQTWIDKHPNWLFVFWTDNPQNYDQGEYVFETEGDFEQYLSKKEYEENMVVVDVRGVQLYNQHFYDSSKNYGERADLLRYEIIYRYGGVYLDTDFACLHPIDVFHHCYDFYVGIQPLDVTVLALGNSLFGAVPGHPILKDCIERMKDGQSEKEIWERTGSVPMTKSFFHVVPECEGCVVAFPPTYFYPIGLEQKQYLKNIERHIKPESYAVHFWDGTWL